MAFVLDDYIDRYVQDAGHTDKKVAQHLKEIIPKTIHLDEKAFNEIIEELKSEMDKGENFKNAFRKICERYILKGDIVRAELPHILTRIILNETKLLEKIAKDRAISLNRENIKRIVESKNQRRIARLFRNLTLSVKKVVFATFDENEPEEPPFKDYNLNDIINMLALYEKSPYKEDHPITGVSIRYKNRSEILKKYPVFSDAGWYDKFYPSEQDDKYGRTKSLEPSLKGMPEIVHENLKLADVIEEIEFLREL